MPSGPPNAGRSFFWGSTGGALATAARHLGQARGFGGGRSPRRGAEDGVERAGGGRRWPARTQQRTPARAPGTGAGGELVESLILAQDQRWRRA